MLFRLQWVLKIGGVWTTDKSHFFHSFEFMNKKGAGPNLSRSWKKAAALSPEPTMASLAHAYAISGQEGKGTEDSHPAQD